MAESNKGAIAAVFAAGLAAGGGGAGVVQNEQIVEANARADAAVAIVDQLDTHMPTIKTYISNAAEMTVTDVLDDKLPAVRADQLRMIADDMDADIAQGENVALRDLIATLAGKIEPNWMEWYALNFSNYLQAQIQTGVAVGNLSYDQLVRLKDVTDAMRAVSVLHTPETPAELERDQQSSVEALKEYEARQDEKARMLETHGGLEP